MKTTLLILLSNILEGWLEIFFETIWVLPSLLLIWYLSFPRGRTCRSYYHPSSSRRFQGRIEAKRVGSHNRCPVFAENVGAWPD